MNDLHEDTKPMVSVWMITYNHDKYIAEAIEGVLKQQTQFKFELIIGEDGSTDGTARIVKEYTKKYPDIIKARFNNPNIGMMPNMIKTLKECSGKYIALCEGDDYWTDPLKLQKQVEFLESNPDYVVCYHDAKIVDQFGNTVADSKLPEKFRGDFTPEELMKGAWALTLSILFRNVVAEYPDEMFKVVNGDTFLTVLLGSYGKGKYLDQIQPAVYREHQGGVWSSLNEDSKNFISFNSRLYMYQYHLRSTSKEFAVDFLFEIVFPYFKKISPDKNPFSAQLRERDLREQRLRDCLHDMSNSYTYRVGALVLWPFKKIKSWMRAINDGIGVQKGQ